MPVSDARALIGALRPKPWPSDRAAAVSGTWRPSGTTVVYIADGLIDGSDFARFEKRLSAIGRVTEICCAATSPKLLLPPEPRPIAWSSTSPAPPAAAGNRRDPGAEQRWKNLARAEIHLASGETSGAASLTLPLELRNRLSQLVLDGAPRPVRSCCWMSGGGGGRSDC